MNESGEQMLHRWFASEPTGNEGTTGQEHEVPRDGAHSTHEPRRETPGPAGVGAMDAEPASGDDRVCVAAGELVRAGDQFAGVEATGAVVETQDSPFAEGDVTMPSYAVARLLEIAISSADSLVEEARVEADRVQ